MENYLYFAEAVVETGDDGSAEALCVPSSSFAGIETSISTRTAVYFNGGRDALHRVILTHTAAKQKDVVKAILQCVNGYPSNGGFVVVADFETGTAVNKSTNVYRGLLDAGATSVVIQNGCDNGRLKGIKRLDSDNGAVKSHSYGTGFVGTSNEPRYSRTREGNIIKTTIVYDLTGKQQKGDAVGDVIGVSGEGDAFIYKNVVAENGVIYKIEHACLEAPTVGSGTSDLDFDLVWAGSGALAFDSAAGAGSILAANEEMVAGKVYTLNDPRLAADTYLYVTEGDASGSANAVFNGGQFMVTLYGAALIQDDVIG